MRAVSVNDIARIAFREPCQISDKGYLTDKFRYKICIFLHINGIIT